VLFGVWALVHVAVFSSQQGIFHPYYVSALAPAIAALCGAGIVTLVQSARRSWAALVVLDAGIAVSAWVAVVLLERTSGDAPELRIVIPLAAALAIMASISLRTGSRPHRPAALPLAALAATVALLAGPASYSVASVGRSLSGNNVLAGPAGGASSFTPGSGGISGRGGEPGTGPGSGPRAGAPLRAGAGSGPRGALGSGGGGAVSGPSGATGGRLSSAVIAYLEAHQGAAKYLLAASGSQVTAPIIIATGRAVVTIGGFNGGDPAPTVSQLAKLVADGQLRYVLISSGGGGPGDGSSQAISSWVKSHGAVVKSVTVSGGVLYRVS